jgi:TPP-dependent 2-oxoacid decarboxylase
MLATSAANQSFEAIKDSDPAHPQNTTKIQFWSHITDFVQYVNQADLVNDTTGEKCFGLIKISFKKNLTNDFSLLKKSNVAAQDNLILGKEYIIHFKNNAAN